MTKELLKWGIIGPGQIAHQFIKDMQFVTACSNEVVSVLSGTLQDAEKFASQYHIPQYFDDLEKMLAHSNPDIVYIATPHTTHFGYALACLQHRVPVLCEKPFALNAKQGEMLVHTARELNTFLMEGMWIRFLPDIKLIMELLKQNTIGKLTAVVANMSYRAPKNKHNRFYNPALGGGSLLDLGIYPVYLALLTLGIPRSVKATALLSRELIDKSCTVIFEYETSAYAVLESSIIKDTNRKAFIFGEDGRIIIEKPWNEKPEKIVVSLYNNKEKVYPCNWKGRGFQFEIEEVFNCLRIGLIESPLHRHRQSLILLEILDEIRVQTGICYPSDDTRHP